MIKITPSLVKRKINAGDIVTSSDMKFIGIVYSDNMLKRVAWSNGANTNYNPKVSEIFEGTIEVTS